MVAVTFAVGVLAAVVAGLSFGLRTGVGVALGAGLALGNLWAIRGLVGALVGRGGQAAFWALVGAAKLLLLLGVVYLLVFAGFADILPLVVGYGALPVGLVGAQVVAPAPRDERG